MRPFLNFATITTAALVAAVVLYVGGTLPPRALRLDGPVPATTVTGGYHVHTARSDGTGTVDEIAAAAADAGLAFVIFTDHGDGTGPTSPPSYRHGVLCIDAAEINTTGGHLVALGLATDSPYPLAGNPRDVIDDIHRLGGWAVLAHPDSPNPELRWRAQNVLFDGIEWQNIDSEWRDERPAHLLATAGRYLIRPAEAIASLFSRPVRTLDRWDMAARRRPIFGLAALDAHANIAWREAEEPRRRAALAQPTYAAMFRTVGQSVILDAPLSGIAQDDARRIVGAITSGRTFSIVRAFAAPATLEFSAEQGGRRVGMGQRLENPGAMTTFRAAVAQAPGAQLTLLADGRPVATGRGSLEHPAPASPGVYRVEVMLPGGSAPWMMSNPIVIDAPDQPAPSDPTDSSGDLVPVSSDPEVWTIEREPSSSGRVSGDDGALRFAFGLGTGQPRGQYAALAVPIETTPGIDRIEFIGRASRPLRLSLQVRLPGGRDGQRWRRSVYLDETPRPIRVSLQEFDPVEPYTSQRPIVANVRTLLFVVDTLNSRPGAEGEIWISKVMLGTRDP